jgi:uncharacterized protein (DUF2141 family)
MTITSQAITRLFDFRLLLLALLFLFASCAQVVRPTGGITDSKPPVVLNYFPENKTSNFHLNSFTIKFDEYFVVKDINKQWIISPPLKAAPDYKIKGKTLIVSFTDTLKENTTYNFNFGKSVADVNEGNELLGLSYIFSTGSYIDSLKLSGSVFQALNNNKEKEVLVMLYEENRCIEDSFPYKILPDYFAISDASGNYTINYIKPGKYRAIALKDANSNYLFDSFEEPVGFCDSVIKLDKNATLDFSIFKEIEEKTYLKNKFNSEYGCFTVIVNKPLTQLAVMPLHANKNDDWAIVETNPSKDTIQIYLTDFSLDSIKLAIINNALPIDTVEFPVLPREKFTGKNKRAIESKLLIKSTPVAGGEKDLNVPLTLSCNHPVKQVHADSIVLQVRKQLLPFTLKKTDEVGKKYQLDCTLSNDSSYQLLIKPGAFIDCFGNKNDTLRASFRVPSIETTGNLYLTLSADSSAKPLDFKKNQYLLQLLNEKGEALNTQKVEKFGTFNYLQMKPGNYKAQLIIDHNKNGKWDTGKYLHKQQAEPIIFMSGNVNLRANWDVEEDWKISSVK